MRPLAGWPRQHQFNYTGMFGTTTCEFCKILRGGGCMAMVTVTYIVCLLKEWHK